MKLRNKNDLPSEGLDIETLMEALFYRDEFIAIASHELKTPLTSIRLQAQVFRRNTKKENGYSQVSVDRMVDLIDMQTLRLMKLVEKMLDISRIRSGQLIMTKDYFDLSELVHEVVEKNQEASPIHLEIEKNLSFFGDRERIAQVLSKLLKNANLYGKGLPIKIKLSKKRNKIFLSVADLGEGISEEDQQRIFHRFQRAIAASEVSGLGLGLYISREIVEAHDGKISVKSRPDQGATFSIEFKHKEPV